MAMQLCVIKIHNMKYIIQLEELALMAPGISGLSFSGFDFSWWVWTLLFMSPDISFFAYLGGMKVGTFTYNILHHRGVAVVVGLSGFFLGQNILLLIGLILYTHASFDRMLGYGLKFTSGFKHTHLNMMHDRVTLSNEKLSEL